MSPRNIVIGQKVTDEKVVRAHELRREMTEAEAVLWRELRGGQLAGWHFRRQQVIHGFIVDFYCHQAALIVEVDGPIHEQQVDADQERDDILNQCGLRTIRFTNQQVLTELPLVLQSILAATTNIDH